MMLFHQNCDRYRLFWRLIRRRSDWNDVRRGLGGVGRMWLAPQDPTELVFCTRTYRCASCGAQVHIDMNWKEGALEEPGATLC